MTEREELHLMVRREREVPKKEELERWKENQES